MADPERRGRDMLLRPWAPVAAILALAGHDGAAWAQGGRSVVPDELGGEIIVIGTPEFLRGIPPERRLGPDEIAGYGLSTIDELVAELGVELGDRDQPVFVVNGERVDDLDQIAAFPVEAVERLEVLPRGAGARVGASGDRRVYSLSLRQQFRSLTATVAPRFATEGQWSGLSAEAILTSIRDQQRINLALRIRDEEDLRESDRDILQPVPSPPFDLRGNVVADPRTGGAEIDPALSMVAGRPVTLAAVPAGSSPTLADFAAGADTANSTDLGLFRTLRPEARSYDLNLSFSDRLAPWLTATASARLGRAERRSLLGLPGRLFLLLSTNAASPFSRAVGLAFYGDPIPLDQRTRTDNVGLDLALNATLGSWRLRLSGSHQRVETSVLTERSEPLPPGAFAILPDSRNPFAGGLGDLFPIVVDRNRAQVAASRVQADLNGSPFSLPAGPVRTALEARLGRTEIETRSRFADGVTARRFSRSERGVRGTIELPLASRTNGVLAAIGDLNATLEFAVTDFSRIGSGRQSGYGLVWVPRDGLRLRAYASRIRRPADLPLLFDPTVTTPGIRTFDALRGETVDVTWITGGNPALAAQRDRSEQLSAILQPWSAIDLQLSADFTANRNRNVVTGLNPASLPILLAFPERFERDANGLLVSVDARPVNFARLTERSLRYGFNGSFPLGSSAPTGPANEAGAQPGGPRPRLQFHANHTILLAHEVQLRPGLAPIDLLDGSAIDLSGGRPRHMLDFSIGLSARGLGARLTGAWRSASRLEARLGDSVARLRFAPLATFDLRLFADGQRLFPRARWLGGARISVLVVNLANSRQRVSDPFGNTPFQYQPGYMDPLGRTIEIELRKQF